MIFHQETPIQLRFNDLDSFGHVNNTTIQEYFDLGRIFYFRKVFGEPIDWDNFQAIVASIKTDFMAPVFLNDQLVVKTKITKIGNKSIQLSQILVEGEKVIKATCDSVMVGFNPKTQSSIEISDKWRKQIKALETDLEE